MTNSIIGTIKEMLGVVGEDFDIELLVIINSSLLKLSQLIDINDNMLTATSEWADLNIKSQMKLNGSKNYIYLTTKLQFDPPNQSFTITAYKEQLTELSYRLSH